MMRLEIRTPSELVFEGEASKVTLEGPAGSFCFLPRHIDFASALVPGILAYCGPEGNESYVAVDEGQVVKKGPDVLVSVRAAIPGAELGRLKEAVKASFAARGDEERAARRALARLEADFMKRFMELS
jgi:F-type H+-transporting ATPase subunit epsilon